LVSNLGEPLKRSVRRLAMIYKFEDYSVQTGLLNSGEGHFAAIEEFPALVEAGQSVEEAVEKLRVAFVERLKYLHEIHRDVPRPGSGKAKIEFVPHDQIEVLRPLVELFWRDVLEQSYNHSYVSNESSLVDWEHAVTGGRPEIVARTLKRFAVDISDCYDGTVVDVLQKIKAHGVA
jgi:hypothetical protein